MTPPEPLEPDSDSSGPCFDAGPSNGGGNVMLTKTESENLCPNAGPSHGRGYVRPTVKSKARGKQAARLPPPPRRPQPPRMPPPGFPLPCPGHCSAPPSPLPQPPLPQRRLYRKITYRVRFAKVPVVALPSLCSTAPPVKRDRVCSWRTPAGGRMTPIGARTRDRGRPSMPSSVRP